MHTEAEIKAVIRVLDANEEMLSDGYGYYLVDHKDIDNEDLIQDGLRKIAVAILDAVKAAQ